MCPVNMDNIFLLYSWSACHQLLFTTSTHACPGDDEDPVGSGYQGDSDRSGSAEVDDDDDQGDERDGDDDDREEGSSDEAQSGGEGDRGACCACTCRVGVVSENWVCCTAVYTRYILPPKNMHVCERVD